MGRGQAVFLGGEIKATLPQIVAWFSHGPGKRKTCNQSAGSWQGCFWKGWHGPRRPQREKVVGEQHFEKNVLTHGILQTLVSINLYGLTLISSAGEWGFMSFSSLCSAGYEWPTTFILFRVLKALPLCWLLRQLGLPVPRPMERSNFRDENNQKNKPGSVLPGKSIPWVLVLFLAELSLFLDKWWKED